jgi:hypothetical protein
VSLLASAGGGCGGGSTNKPKAMRSQRGQKVVPTAFEKKQSAALSSHALKNPFEILFERRVKMTQ